MACFEMNPVDVSLIMDLELLSKVIFNVVKTCHFLLHVHDYMCVSCGHGSAFCSVSFWIEERLIDGYLSMKRRVIYRSDRSGWIYEQRGLMIYIWFSCRHLSLQGLPSLPPTPPPHSPLAELVITATKVMWGCDGPEKQRTCYTAPFNFHFLSPHTTSYDVFFFSGGGVSLSLHLFCRGGGPPSTSRYCMFWGGKKVLAQRTWWGKLEDESEAESMSTSPWAESNKLH